MKFLIPYFLTTLVALGGVVEFADGGIRTETRDASATEETLEGKAVLKARLEPTEKWSFVRILPASEAWDLSRYSGVEVQITNDGSVPVKPGVRVDEAGAAPADQKWNSAISQSIAPGDTRTIRVQFGKDYNKEKPIDTSRIAAIHIFLGQNRVEASELTIHSVTAFE